MAKPFKIKVGDKHSFDITPEMVRDLDMVRIDERHWHIIDDGTSYTVELVAMDYPKRKMTLLLNGERFDIEIEDKYEQLIQKMGLTKEVVLKISEIKAPMPGLVLAVNVKEGDRFEKGDPLLVLEAMKMENIIKAPAAGTVAQVQVNEGDTVDKGAVLLTLD